MKNLIPVLGFIGTKLRDILVRSRQYMLSWDIKKLEGLGEELTSLSLKVHTHLAEAEHKVLFLSIREAGLGIKKRVKNIHSIDLHDRDKEYFRSVYGALDNICVNIETGEYYRALIALSEKRTRERLEKESFSS